MSALSSRSARRAAVMAAAFGTAVAYACASGHAKRGSDEAPHDVNIEVQNDLTLPTVISAYILEGLGIRRPLGDVGGGEVKTFTFRPESFGQQYRLTAYRQLARPIFSAPFIIESPMTGTIVWSVYTGIVTFRDRDVAETTYASPNKGPITVGSDTSHRSDSTRMPRDSSRDTTKHSQ